MAVQEALEPIKTEPHYRQVSRADDGRPRTVSTHMTITVVVRGTSNLLLSSVVDAGPTIAKSLSDAIAKVARHQGLQEKYWNHHGLRKRLLDTSHDSPAAR